MREAWKSCQRKVYYRWIGGIRRKAPDNPARAVGRAYHLGLELWRQGHMPTQAVSVAREDLEASLRKMKNPGDIESELAKLDAYLCGYFKRFPDDPHREWSEAELKLEWRGEIGFIDTVFRDENDTLIILDDKTSGMKPHDDLGEALQLNDQLLSYVCMMQDLGYHDSDTILYRVVVKTKSLPQKKKAKGKITIEKPELFYQRMQRDYLKGDKYYEFKVTFTQGQINQYRQEKEKVNDDLTFILNSTNAEKRVTRNSSECIGKFGPCDYLGLCSGSCSSPKHVYETTGNLPMDGGYLRTNLEIEEKKDESTESATEPAATGLQGNHPSQAPDLPGPPVRGSVNAPVWTSGSGEIQPGSEGA
jgi:hypothetical protein